MIFLKTVNTSTKGMWSDRMGKIAMDYKLILLLIVILNGVRLGLTQHEDIPYENVEKICETCVCLTAQDAKKHTHHMLSCVMKNFKHILARWPEDFGKNHNGIDIVATFSSNSIGILQQLPATNASLTFTCRHCGIKQFQAPTFMDVPNIRRLDLSWNEITADELTVDVFRGPYRATRYEPIGLMELDLSHNHLTTLDKKLFEHTPNITKLNLSYNKLTKLDNSLTTALTSARSLKNLDLSYTAIKDIPPKVFETLVNLKVLNIAGNKFRTLPDNLQMIGKSLEILNLAGNQLVHLVEESFLGLKALRRLNISDMGTLKTIAGSAFTRLETLEYLYCSHNPLLRQFELDGLLHCRNLTHLDISYCSITTLTFSVDIPENNTDANDTSVVRSWPNLRFFETVGNPWNCNCHLLQTLEFAGSQHRTKDTETRCETPYFLAGAKLSNITAKQICSLKVPEKYRAIDEEPPRFLRKRYIILTVIIASVVVVLGIVIGFLVACIRRRLKHNDFGIEPIRYTSVRSSNLSALSHTNTNGANGNANTNANAHANVNVISV